MSVWTVFVLLGTGLATVNCVKSKVSCSETAMKFEVEKSSLPRVYDNKLWLSDTNNVACQVKSNRTHFIAVAPLNSCGTQLEENADNLIFKNEITTVYNEVLITRKHLLELRFYCQYPKRGNVRKIFTARRDNITVFERGFGTFTYVFEFYRNSKFQNIIEPDSYPVQYEVGETIFMQIEATSTAIDTILFVESCRAAPYDTPNYSPTYSIIEDGCFVDPTVREHAPSIKRHSRFSMEAFKFIGLHDQVYISCSVLMCKAGDPNTRCSQGCIETTKQGFSRRVKRNAATQTLSHFVSQGPIRLKRSAESTGSPVMKPNVNLVVGTGWLLAAVGMISAVVMYKGKGLRVKYQPLIEYESSATA
uniref:CUB and zona pellucida-like domain-containing protein 1 n=1 Tax=Scatophagus argus TaxID=75038 RepID=UPI001ED840EB|nr:CUB and zona pellucida-like domain-containing protein 1 [Scatophagus argus]